MNNITYLISNLNIEINSIIPLFQFNNQWALQKLENKSLLISNSCLHRGAMIVKEKQTYKENLVCPLHRWTYDQNGKLLGEPIPGITGCLKTYETSVWNNLIFKGNFKGLEFPNHLKEYFDTNNYVHTKTEIMNIKSSWQIFMEVYLDLYHVKPYHPGLGAFVDMDRFNWHFGPNWSIQEVMLNQNNHENPDCHFRDLRKMIALNYPNINRGALWMTIYPNIMLEWHPNMLTVSTIWPGTTEKESINIVEYHHLYSVAAFDQEFIETQTACYQNTANEDAEICEIIQNGRSKDAVCYPTHPILEKGVEKFYEYLAATDVTNFLKIRDFE